MISGHKVDFSGFLQLLINALLCCELQHFYPNQHMIILTSILYSELL